MTSESFRNNPCCWWMFRIMPFGENIATMEWHVYAGRHLHRIFRRLLDIPMDIAAAAGIVYTGGGQ